MHLYLPMMGCAYSGSPEGRWVDWLVSADQVQLEESPTSGGDGSGTMMRGGHLKHLSFNFTWNAGGVLREQSCMAGGGALL